MHIWGSVCFQFFGGDLQFTIKKTWNKKYINKSINTDYLLKFNEININENLKYTNCAFVKYPVFTCWCVWLCVYECFCLCVNVMKIVFRQRWSTRTLLHDNVFKAGFLCNFKTLSVIDKINCSFIFALSLKK